MSPTLAAALRARAAVWGRGPGPRHPRCARRSHCSAAGRLTAWPPAALRAQAIHTHTQNTHTHTRTHTTRHTYLQQRGAPVDHLEQRLPRQPQVLGQPLKQAAQVVGARHRGAEQRGVTGKQAGDLWGWGVGGGRGGSDVQLVHSRGGPTGREQGPGDARTANQGRQPAVSPPATGPPPPTCSGGTPTVKR